MNKNRIALVVCLLVLLIGGLFALRILRFNASSSIYSVNYAQECPSADANTIGRFVFAYATTQDGMKVNSYALYGKNGGDGFDYGKKTFTDARSLEVFYSTVLREQKEFLQKYPSESKGSSLCNISDILGYCGVYNGKLALFAWKEKKSYNVVNNFYFSKDELESIVQHFHSCNTQ